MKPFPIVDDPTVYNMTREEYASFVSKKVSGQSVRKAVKMALGWHSMQVRQAHKTGKCVPVHVLNEYKDLLPKFTGLRTRPTQ